MENELTHEMLRRFKQIERRLDALEAGRSVDEQTEIEDTYAHLEHDVPETQGTVQ